MKKRRIIVLLLAFAAIPALAVFREDNLTQTLRVLQSELQADYRATQSRSNSSQKRIAAQHQMLVQQVEKSNELSLMLYSQPQDYTFDLTYALQQATRQYEDFSMNRMPYEEIVRNISVEMDRYNKLAQTLRNIPPVRTDESNVPQIVVVIDSVEVNIDTLAAIPTFAVQEGYMMDSLTTAYRDSCLFYAEELVNYYYVQIKAIEEDNQYYEETNELLRDAYEYAKVRYESVQKKIFQPNRQNYFRTLTNLPRQWDRVVKDLRWKYTLGEGEDEFDAGSWRGPVIWLYSLAMLMVLIFSNLLSYVLVRVTMKRIPYFQGDYFRNHRGLIITMVGVVIFSIITLVQTFGDVTNFYVVAAHMMSEFAILLATIFLSMLIRLDNEQTRPAILAYLPTLLMAFCIIFLRIIFIPDSALNLFFPPIILLFTLWQLLSNFAWQTKLPKEDRALLWVSCLVMAVSTFFSWTGMVMMALLILIWWFYQMMLLQALIALRLLLTRHYGKNIKNRQLKYRKENPHMPLPKGKGAYIQISWFYDFLTMTLIPQLFIWSVPIAIELACRTFSLTTIANQFFQSPLINVDGLMHVSLFKLALAVTLYFFFKYLVYASKSFYRVFKTKNAISKLKDPSIFKESDINYNLIYNILTLVGWGLYVAIVFQLLNIPTSSLTLVTTGLVAGIGFAMKDVLNNFFYGLQLMGGRVRVGDLIECDGIRGTVESMNYQSTQITSEDGSVIAFPNTALFNKNFKNITKNHQYELIGFVVGVKYGTDVEKARQVILEALQPLLVKDKYGRDIVDVKKGINVRFSEFADSSVNIKVTMFASVDVHYSLPAQAKEAIYNAFNENGIEIPFPQQDVYVKQLPLGDD